MNDVKWMYNNILFYTYNQFPLQNIPPSTVDLIFAHYIRPPDATETIIVWSLDYKNFNQG